MNKALTGENSVFTRRGRISEREQTTAARNESRFRPQNDNSVGVILHMPANKMDVDMPGPSTQDPLNNTIAPTKPRKVVNVLVVPENNLNKKNEGDSYL